MTKEEKATAVIGLIVIIAILLTVIAVSAAYILHQGGIGMKKAVPPSQVAYEYLAELDRGEDGEQYAISSDGSRLFIDRKPMTDDGQVLYNMLQGQWSCTLDSAVQEKRTASVPVLICCPDISLMQESIRQNFQDNLRVRAADAHVRSDIYNEDGSYRQEILDEAYQKALDAACTTGQEETVITISAILTMAYEGRAWKITNEAKAGNTLDERAAALREAVIALAQEEPITYVIDETAKSAPMPDPSRFGKTDNPAELTALLETAEAKRLIGDQQLLWNPDTERFPGTSIRYYLDESILMIEWQEVEAQEVGTFAEIIVADGSQFRRKIAGDAYGDMNFRTTTDFCKETNAVVASGGDFYNHARNCGIVVYDRGIYRFDNLSCDTCYVNSNGDLLFSYRGQFSQLEEAQQFVDDNDIIFSLCFGPVLIDNGQDVTPANYTWGEINDTYARSAIGTLGEHHYLLMNLNHGEGQYYYLATLRQAADAMIKRGCINAYTLDGGQTATISVNGELINPVQFGNQKAISDIIYFGSAIPAE